MNPFCKETIYWLTPQFSEICLCSHHSAETALWKASRDTQVNGSFPSPTPQMIHLENDPSPPSRTWGWTGQVLCVFWLSVSFISTLPPCSLFFHPIEKGSGLLAANFLSDLQLTLCGWLLLLSSLVFLLKVGLTFPPGSHSCLTDPLESETP